jgi:undecaprenyl-diphosphatase
MTSNKTGATGDKNGMGCAGVGRIRDAVAVVAASGGGVLLGVLLKVIFGRERPSVVPHLVSAHSGSFPSGHSMLSAIVYSTLGALLARFAKRRGTQVLPIAAAIAITFLVGVSRLVLGVHYPTDVLAGWAAGAAWAGVAWIAVDRLARQGKVEGRASGPQPPAAG